MCRLVRGVKEKRHKTRLRSKIFPLNDTLLHFLLSSIQSRKTCIWLALFVVTVSNYTWSGAESGFVRHEAYTVSGTNWKTKNTQLGTKVNMYLE